MEPDTLAQAFETLKTYDWGVDKKLLDPIKQAVVDTEGDTAARLELENQLAAVLTTDAPRDAKDFVCRRLMVIGTAASVPTLATLLTNAELSHMSRYALERIQAPEAAAALRDALPKVSGDLKIGVIGSLGARKDVESIPALAVLVTDSDVAVANSAATALGDIGTAAAAEALDSAKPTTASVDAALVCAESLLADGNKADALAVYKVIAGLDQPKYVKLAATRGMLKCAGR